MKLENVALVTNEAITTLAAVYRDGSNEKQYTFLVAKDFLKYIKIGDSVIAEAAKSSASRLDTPSVQPICVVIVKEIHEESEIDLDSDIEYKWVFGHIDFTYLHNLKNSVQEASKELKKQQRAHLRDTVKKQVTNGLLFVKKANDMHESDGEF